MKTNILPAKGTLVAICLIFSVLLIASTAQASPGLSNGTACTSASECLSGNCVDGYCCDTACGGGLNTDCMACNVGRHLGTCWAAPSTRVCRTSAGTCDAIEKCDGINLDCPADSFKPYGTLCKASTGVCDANDLCTGSSASCPATFYPSTTLCRIAAGECDVDDYCTGSTSTCTDKKKSSATVCRPSAGVCDVADKCDGKTNDCPADKYAAATVRCRNAAGTCDQAEYCTGAGIDCPANVYKSSGTVCRAATNSCDIAEVCTGVSILCPANAVKANGTACDDALYCDGTDTCYQGKCQKHSGDPCPAPSVCEEGLGMCTEAWADPVTGLTWQNGSGVGVDYYTYQGAKDYCANLSWGGYSDWRLPDIDDLRGLIRGCDGTETGGACGVTNDCLDSSCWNDPCGGCSGLKGPGSGGAYWPPDISGNVYWYWSSSPVPDSDSDAWAVGFDYGFVYSDWVGHYDLYGARCVR